jgi:hypothetical protein
VPLPVTLVVVAPPEPKHLSPPESRHDDCDEQPPHKCHLLCVGIKREHAALRSRSTQGSALGSIGASH